jgi:hypothetical protein
VQTITRGVNRIVHAESLSVQIICDIYPFDARTMNFEACIHTISRHMHIKGQVEKSYWQLGRDEDDPMKLRKCELFIETMDIEERAKSTVLENPLPWSSFHHLPGWKNVPNFRYLDQKTRKKAMKTLAKAGLTGNFFMKVIESFSEKCNFELLRHMKDVE